MKISRGNRSIWRKPAPAPLCPPQITLARPGLEPGPRVGKPATNRLSYGAAYDADDNGNTLPWLTQNTSRCLPDEIKETRKTLKQCRRFEQSTFIIQVRNVTARTSWLELDVECWTVVWMSKLECLFSDTDIMTLFLLYREVKPYRIKSSGSYLLWPSNVLWNRASKFKWLPSWVAR
jgi:hypothetical protein